MMTETQSLPTYSLAVDRAELVDALKAIMRFKRRAGGFVRFAYADGELSIAMPGVTIRVAAQGSWPTEVTMASAWLKPVAKVPPKSDPVPVTFDGQRVRIGTTTFPGVGDDGTLSAGI